MMVIANPGPNRINFEEDGGINIQDNNGDWKNQTGSYDFALPSIGVWRRAEQADYDQGEFILNGTPKALNFSGVPDSSNLIVNPSNSYLTLGHNSIGFSGQIFEALIFDKPLSNEKIRKIEGYLAHKWGTELLLPGNHPYKAFSPNLRPLLLTSSSFDFENNASTYSIRVQAKDEYNATTEGNFTITLTDFIDTPEELAPISQLRFSENQPLIDSAPTNRKLLAITITDEAEGAPSVLRPYYNGDGGANDAITESNFLGDKASWNAMISDLGITAEIAVIVTESIVTAETPAGGIDTDGGEVVPNGYNETTDLAGFAKVYRGLGRERFTVSANGRSPNMSNSIDQANFLWAKFQEMTNNGTELPYALGIFVDNSGSQYFNEVNQALFQFVDQVRNTFPNIILPSDSLTVGATTSSTDPDGEDINKGTTGIFRGIYLAGAEDWINQSMIALQNLLDNDPTFQAAIQPKRIVVGQFQAQHDDPSASITYRLMVSELPGFSLIPGGWFTMGALEEDNYAKSPRRRIFVNEFFMDQTEITLERWQTVRTWAQANGYSDLQEGSGSGPNHPLTNVSWFNMTTWCNAASEMEGLTPVYYDTGGLVIRDGNGTRVWDKTADGYRLPTEAEWEKAAKGGNDQYRFPWGNTISFQQANYSSNGSTYGDLENGAGGNPNFTDFAPVGSFPANGYGLYDTSGNVWELCWDNTKVTPDVFADGSIDPIGSGGNTYRAMKGGSRFESASGVRPSERVYYRALNYQTI